jgi:hypothetical protein
VRTGANRQSQPVLLTIFWPEAVCEGRAERVRSTFQSDVYLFCYRQGIVDLDAEIADGTLDFRVPQKKLYAHWLPVRR